MEGALFYFLPDDVVLKRFSCNQLKYPVKMKGRIGTDLSNFFQRKVSIKMRINVLNCFYDPFFICFQNKRYISAKVLILSLLQLSIIAFLQ